jgi:hypothetical protein
MSDDEDPVGKDRGFDNSGGIFEAEEPDHDDAFYGEDGPVGEDDDDNDMGGGAATVLGINEENGGAGSTAASQRITTKYMVRMLNVECSVEIERQTLSHQSNYISFLECLRRMALNRPNTSVLEFWGHERCRSA